MLLYHHFLLWTHFIIIPYVCLFVSYEQDTQWKSAKNISYVERKKAKRITNISSTKLSLMSWWSEWWWWLWLGKNLIKIVFLDGFFVISDRRKIFYLFCVWVSETLWGGKLDHVFVWLQQTVFVTFCEYFCCIKQF